MLTTINTRWEASQRVMAANLIRLVHKITIKLHLVVESCTICTSRSRWPFRKLLDTPLYLHSSVWFHGLVLTDKFTFNFPSYWRTQKLPKSWYLMEQTGLQNFQLENLMKERRTVCTSLQLYRRGPCSEQSLIPRFDCAWRVAFYCLCLSESITKFSFRKVPRSIRGVMN
jgi:hypothetical protein